MIVKLTASVLNASDDFGASPNFLGALAAASTILSKAAKSTAPIYKKNNLLVFKYIFNLTV